MKKHKLPTVEYVNLKASEFRWLKSQAKLAASRRKDVETVTDAKNREIARIEQRHADSLEEGNERMSYSMARVGQLECETKEKSATIDSCRARIAELEKPWRDLDEERRKLEERAHHYAELEEKARQAVQLQKFDSDENVQLRAEVERLKKPSVETGVLLAQIHQLKLERDGLALECQKLGARLQSASLYPSEAEKGLKAALAKIALLEDDIKQRQAIDKAVPGENLGYLKERFLMMTQDRDRLKQQLDEVCNRKNEQDGLMRKICEIVCEDCDR